MVPGTIRHITRTALLVWITLAWEGALAETPEGESWDGLVEVKAPRASRAWIMPEVDVRSYTKMRLEGAGIHYRPVKKVSRSAAMSGRVDEFPIDEDARARLQEIVRETFVEELAKTERFEIVEEPGPHTITVRAALLDVVSHRPPDTVGRSDVYVSVYGEATLALEIVDSQSNTTIARAVQRRAAQPPGGQLRLANPVTGQAEVRRLMNTWARELRRLLDGIDEVWERETQ